jgi:hypothetical protein
VLPLGPFQQKIKMWKMPPKPKRGSSIGSLKNLAKPN